MLVINNSAKTTNQINARVKPRSSRVTPDWLLAGPHAPLTDFLLAAGWLGGWVAGGWWLGGWVAGWTGWVAGCLTLGFQSCLSARPELTFRLVSTLQPRPILQNYFKVGARKHADACSPHCTDHGAR